MKSRGMLHAKVEKEFLITSQGLSLIPVNNSAERNKKNMNEGSLKTQLKSTNGHV
jgi:hypothetical protein